MHSDRPTVLLSSQTQSDLSMRLRELDRVSKTLNEETESFNEVGGRREGRESEREREREKGRGRIRES